MTYIITLIVGAVGGTALGYWLKNRSVLKQAANQVSAKVVKLVDKV